MKQENHPKEVRSNDRGANQDVDKEILGASSKSGEYLDGRNLRVSSIKSERAAAEKIKGEQLVHSNVATGIYECIGATSVNNKKFEVWVEKTGAENPIITIDGVIVSMSDKLPFLVDFPLQIDKNESCIGGEVFITDNNTPPLIYNIQDMIDSLVTNPDKYFLNYNPSLYTVNLDNPLNIPVFDSLVDVGGSNGLPIGSYIYSLRYVTADGDRTNWTPATPPIPVVENLNLSGNVYPGSMTIGGDSNVLNGSNYGIKLRFRVNNSSNFDFLEIRRQSYNQELSNVITPDSFIVAKIDISDGEISVREFIDPVDSNVDDAITEEDEINDLAIINRAKAIRYHDKRLVLMNVGFESRNIDNITFEKIGTENAIPVVKKLFKTGFKDPYNHTYNKRYIGGEKYGFGVTLFGSGADTSFAKAIPGFENYEFPNRRDPLSADSKTYSYLGAPTAATVTGSVDQTFEVFDNENATRKTDLCAFKNIIIQGSKTLSAVTLPFCPLPPIFGSQVQCNELGYLPMRPVSKSDTDLRGQEYRINIGAYHGGSFDNYDPLAYAPNYYTMGLAVGGIKNIPSWAKGFSVGRTDPAKRVLAQGIGVYSLTPGAITPSLGGVGITTALPTKAKNKFWFYTGDLALQDSSLINDIVANPEDYSVQLVSPLGFFSNVYSFEKGLTDDRSLDMITYARVLHDEGQINCGEWAGMGVPSGGKNYVAHNKYRNADPASGGVFGGNGNKEIKLKSALLRTEGRSSVIDLELDEDVYIRDTAITKDFDDPNTRQWHEPFYIINIINTGAEIRDKNVENYKSTGHFQKIESIIGVGDSTPDQSFELVDERWEDCIPDLSPSGSFAGFFSYVYMVDSLGVSKTWMNVTYKTPLEITNIINDIISNGFYVPEPGVQVVGLYTHTNTNNRNFTLEFNVPSYYPTADDFITVRYDDRRPIQVFGGDSVVAENVFCPIDRTTDDPDDFNPANQFILNTGFPFDRYNTNPRYYEPVNKLDFSSGFNGVGQDSSMRLSYIRQLLIMFAGETRLAVNYAKNSNQNQNNQSYPTINYVMRPHRYPPTTVYPEYFEDYGIGESLIFNYGGFRFKQNMNIDYSYDGPIQYFSKPEFGFTENNEFCTAVIWSLPRAINVQDSPGLKTFTSTNRIDIADDQGAIKKAWDATTGGKGENLYAITNKGVCLLLTKKAILSNIDANDLTTTNVDEFISGEYWLSKSIGSTDEMWRGMGEGTISMPTETGSVEVEVLYFPNRQSVYSLSDNQIKDIGRNKYLSRLSPFLKGLAPGYGGKLSGFINPNNNEYWIDIEDSNNESRELFVYGSENALWEGSFDYRFDKYYMSENKIFGARDLQTFELDKGYVINNANIIYELTTAFSPGNISLEKEFIRIGVQSGVRGEMKPTSIEFYDQDMTLLCSLSQFTQGTLFLKQYDGWEQFIGRKDATVSPNRDRVQERCLIVRVIHNKPEDFKVVTTTIQYKIIK